MRVSGRKTSARYVGRYFPDGCKVFLDGVEIMFVAEADDEAGYVIHYVWDDKRFLAEKGEMITERKEGKVEFVGTRRTGQAFDAAEAKRARRAARNLRNTSRAGAA